MPPLYMTATGACAALSGSVNPAFQEGAAFLRELGLENTAEIARILDVAMNPNSLFVSFRDKKRAVNGSVRFLSQTLLPLSHCCASQPQASPLNSGGSACTSKGASCCE